MKKKTIDQMGELITLDKVVPYQWYPCGDENYWCEESDEYGDTFKDFVTLVSYKFDYSDAPSDKFVNMRHDCSYGWSTLAKMGAMFMIIKKPIFKEEVLKC